MMAVGFGSLCRSMFVYRWVGKLSDCMILDQRGGVIH